MSNTDASAAASGVLTFQRPVYVVLCPVSGDPDEEYKPFDLAFEPGVDPISSSFDEELVPILPAIWYALHLPKTRFEVLDEPLIAMREGMRERKHHQILLLPTFVLDEVDHLERLVRSVGEPSLMICTSDYLGAASSVSSAVGFALPPCTVASLSAGTLRAHWAALSEIWASGWPPGVRTDSTAPPWSSRISMQGSVLSYRRLGRALGLVGTDAWWPGATGTGDAVGDRDGWDDRCEGARQVRNLRMRVEALAELERRDVEADEVPELIGDALAQARRTLRIPLTLALPGVAPRYRRLVRTWYSAAQDLSDLVSASGSNDPGDDHVGTAGLGNSGGEDPSYDDPRQGPMPSEHEPTDAESAVNDLPSISIERLATDPPEVLSLLVAHQAAGDESMGVVCEPIPDAAFVALANLERYWVDSARRHPFRPDPRKEEALRARLDRSMEAFWSDSMRGAIHAASRLDVFSNFPLGLLRMPGDTAPLAGLLPIAYRPINPLTRALQTEFNPDRITDLSHGMKVLVVECIPQSDPVGARSHETWAFAASKLTNPSRSITVDLVLVKDKSGLAGAVELHRPDVLIISAHGVYDPDTNVAGLMIGYEHSLGDDLGPVPPMVILSACHSGPRGAGPIAVSDLLIRAGATTVLSTLVPVGVVHNSTFMFRFLMYMSEVIGGNEEHVSVLDLWHRVQTNSVIIDILHGNPRLTDWGHSDADGVPPIVDFMQTRSAGRIRPTHLYADTEALLVEIATERGQGNVVRNWLRSPGYVPESMMYTFVGDPSSIRLQSPRSIRLERPQF